MYPFTHSYIEFISYINYGAPLEAENQTGALELCQHCITNLKQLNRFCQKLKKYSKIPFLSMIMAVLYSSERCADQSAMLATPIATLHNFFIGNDDYNCDGINHWLDVFTFFFSLINFSNFQKKCAQPVRTHVQNWKLCLMVSLPYFAIYFIFKIPATPQIAEIDGCPDITCPGNAVPYLIATFPDSEIEPFYPMDVVNPFVSDMFLIQSRTSMQAPNRLPACLPPRAGHPG